MIVDFNSETWTDPWFRTLNLDEKLLFIYLWTNSHKNVSGIYALDFPTMAFETGIEHEGIEPALVALYPKIRYDHDRNMVWVINHVKHQFLKSGKLSPKIAVSIRKNLAAIAPHPFVDQFLNYYPTVRDSLSETLDTVSGYSPSEGAGEGSGKGEGEGAGVGKGVGKKGIKSSCSSPSWDAVGEDKPF